MTDAWWSGQVNLQIPASGTTTVDLSRSSLPAGDYLIQAMFYLTAYPVTHNPSDSVQCLVTGSDAQVIQMLDRSQALPSLGRLTVTTAVPPRTKCTSSFASGTTDVQVYASAIRVTNIHQ